MSAAAAAMADGLPARAAAGGGAAWAARRGREPACGDLRDPRPLAAALEGISLMVYAAAYLGPDRALADAVNVAGTQSLADAALAAGAGRLVHISTMSVHGEPQPDGLNEDSPLADARPTPTSRPRPAPSRRLPPPPHKGSR